MNSTKTRHDLKEYLQTHRDVKDCAVSLLSRIKKIKEECKKKKFAAALRILNSRFWTYRYLRNLINEYRKLDQSHGRVSKEWETYNISDQHRYLWWREQAVELSKDEEKMKLFGLDILKELSRGQSIEKHLKVLKNNYIPTEEAELNKALEQIERELINLNNFTQEAINILQTEEAVIRKETAKMLAQNNIFMDIRSDLNHKIQIACINYDQSFPSSHYPGMHTHGRIKSKNISGSFIKPLGLSYVVEINFEAPSIPIKGTFLVNASYRESGICEVSMILFSGIPERTKRVDIKEVKSMANSFLQDFYRVLEEHRRLALRTFELKEFEESRKRDQGRRAFRHYKG